MYNVCIIYILCYLVLVSAQKNKDEYCTDPRTMRKHAAYTEWADAYSCTRHRCQPGGRNLAIYTVGCKRVEAPESAIECEEVVEDTNMQFPYCCTRLRCLVVVRGEVWTRVLGQPWETLPAAPWSHMYKMKKPPPVDGGFLPKGASAGPVYELAEEQATDRRAGLKDCDKPMLRASTPASVPDIVIALTTNNEKKPTDAEIETKFLSRSEDDHEPNDIEAEEPPTFTEKVPFILDVPDIVSEERMYTPDKKTSKDHKPSIFGRDGSDEFINSDKKGKHQKVNTDSEEKFFADTEKKTASSWDQIPPKQWNASPNVRAQAPSDHADPFHESEEKQDKPASLQHLVNAIGTRMRDIENVVQQMSEKVQPDSSERRADRAIPNSNGKESEPAEKAKLPNDNYNRFPPKQGTSKYLHGATDATSEPPLFVGDRMGGYFSDPSNNLLRRSTADRGPKEPQETYMAPVNTDHKKPVVDSAEPEIKHKKRSHKKKKPKHGRRKHHREDREKKFSRVTVEKNAVSLEDSNDLGTGTEKKTERPPRQIDHQKHSHVGPHVQADYWATADQPIANGPMINRPIAHHRNRHGPIQLTFDVADRNTLINDMRKLSERNLLNKYRNL